MRCEAITLNRTQCSRRDGHLFNGKHYCLQHLRIVRRTAEINRTLEPQTTRNRLPNLRLPASTNWQQPPPRVRTVESNGERLVRFDDLIRILNSFDKNNPGLLEEVLQIYGFQRLPTYSQSTLPEYTN